MIIKILKVIRIKNKEDDFYRIGLELDGIPEQVAFDVKDIKSKTDLKNKLKPWAEGMMADRESGNKEDKTSELGGEFTI